MTLQDDPLSALDAHVGRHVMEEAVLKRMVKRKKTVIFVTHHVQYLPHASQVFYSVAIQTVFLFLSFKFFMFIYILLPDLNWSFFFFLFPAP